MLGCPRCGQGLIRYAREDVALVRCWGGHGVWIDNALSHRLASRAVPRSVVDELAQLEAHAPPWDAAAPGACPECRQPLQSYLVELGQLVVDVCKQHGTWLDGGELARITRGEAARDQPLPVGPIRPAPAMTEQQSRENTRRLEALVARPAEGTYARGLRVMPGAILTAIAEGMSDAYDTYEDSDNGDVATHSNLLTSVFGVISYLLSHDD